MMKQKNIEQKSCSIQEVEAKVAEDRKQKNKLQKTGSRSKGCRRQEVEAKVGEQVAVKSWTKGKLYRYQRRIKFLM